MNFGALVIGSEILTGKRVDGHFAFTTRLLARYGLELDWCLYLGDDPRRLTRTLGATLSTADIVFSFGGIGATPDDHTRACAAEAAGEALARHPEAAAIIEARFGAEAHPRRIRMADLPAGVVLIPNPVNRIPGFSLRNHHFVPGFPQMAHPMVEWVLTQRYGLAPRDDGPVERLLVLPDTSEGQLMDLMEAFISRFPSVRLSCLPHMEGDYRETELGLRGARDEVDAAFDWLAPAIDAGGLVWRERGPE